MQNILAQQASYFILGKEEFEGVQVYDVIQDDDFNYWFSTDHGFYLYDSHKFIKIDCDGMKGLSAFEFVKNHKGEIYCYNLNNQIIKIKNKVCSVFYELSENERYNDIYLTISPQNYLIVISKTILVFDAKGEKIKIIEPHSDYFGFPFTTKKDETISHIIGKDSLLVFDRGKASILPLKRGDFKILGSLRFFRIDERVYAIDNLDKKIYSFDENSYQIMALSENSIFPTKEFLRFYEIKNKLWLAGTISGVSVISNPNKINTLEKMYSQFLISDVYEDNEGNILLGTFNNGVLVIPNLNIPDVVALPENLSVLCIHNDNDLGVLMGGLKGELLSFKDNRVNIISTSGTKPLQSVYSWKNFPYVIFDDGEIKAYDKRTKKSTHLLKASLKDAILVDNKYIYLSLNTGVSKINFDDSNLFQKSLIDSLQIRTYSIEFEPKSNCIYIATSDGLKIFKDDNNIKKAVFNGKEVFANDIFCDNKRILVAAKKNGIIFFENGKSIRQIIPKVDSTEVEIYKLIVNNGKIYTNSSKGLVVFDMNGNLLTQLNKVHGFSTNKIFDFEIIDNQLWVCHSKGVQKIDITQLNQKIAKPLIKISKVEVNDSVIANISDIGKFNTNERKFRFVLSSPTLKNKQNIHFFYRLDGYDDKWLIADFDANNILYNALAPGDYTFYARAENQGILSDIVIYKFSIATPFYLSWWFILSSLLIFLVMVWLIYRWQLRTQRKKSDQINELHASKLTAIQSQMNPHFIFNSLNSIQDLILKGDVEHSYSYITTFSNMVRRTLSYSEKDFIDIGQEIKLLELYLSLEKLRFKKDFDYKINIDEINDIMIPPLLIQPFIENSLVHGLLHKSGKKELVIDFKLADVLICVIQDNGIGRAESKIIKERQRSEHESFSSKAILKRFEILSKVFEGKFGYEYEDLIDNNIVTGTRVTLKIPIKYKF